MNDDDEMLKKKSQKIKKSDLYLFTKLIWHGGCECNQQDHEQENAKHTRKLLVLY